MKIPDTIALSSRELQQCGEHVHALPPEDEVRILRFTFSKLSEACQNCSCIRNGLRDTLRGKTGDVYKNIYKEFMCLSVRD